MIAVPRARQSYLARVTAQAAFREHTMVAYNPFSEEMKADPYPVYRRLRDEAPVYRLANYPCWALSRFEDVWNASLDAKSFSVKGGTTPSQLLTKAQAVSPMLNSLDPPEHTAIRARLRPFFAPARIRELEPTIRTLFSEALDEMVEKGGGDLVGEFGTRVALKVASIVSGIPLEDGEMLTDSCSASSATRKASTG